MIAFFDHLLLWAAFFLIGVVVGFYMGYGLIPANKHYRL